MSDKRGGRLEDKKLKIIYRIIRNNVIKNLTVPTVNKYLRHNNLQQYLNLKIPKQVEDIKCSCYRNNNDINLAIITHKEL